MITANNGGIINARNDRYTIKSNDVIRSPIAIRINSGVLIIGENRIDTTKKMSSIGNGEIKIETTRKTAFNPM